MNPNGLLTGLQQLSLSSNTNNYGSNYTSSTLSRNNNVPNSSTNNNNNNATVTFAQPAIPVVTNAGNNSNNLAVIGGNNFAVTTQTTAAVGINSGTVTSILKKKYIAPVTVVSTKLKKVSAAKRAGINFPVGRIFRYLKSGRYADRVEKPAAVYLATVLEYLIAEVLELAGNECRKNKRYRILPRHILLGLKQDVELNELLKNCIIPGGGVLPNLKLDASD